MESVSYSLFLSLFQRVNFTSPFFAPPVVALTPKRSYGNVSSLHEGSLCDAMTAWVEVNIISFLLFDH